MGSVIGSIIIFYEIKNTKINSAVKVRITIRYEERNSLFCI